MRIKPKTYAQNLKWVQVGGCRVVWANFKSLNLLFLTVFKGWGLKSHKFVIFEVYCQKGLKTADLSKFSDTRKNVPLFTNISRIR